ncbi:hypothetical protein [Candidatus Carsonella ruddii]|uniref:hypothetical protein n=1 Tax=Carsonella ruddii TaxID=114186 RepID=UPI003D9A64D2
MKIFIYSILSNINYNNIKIIKIYDEYESYSLMNNHVPSIGKLIFIIFLNNNKLLKINFNNAVYIQKNKNLNIICENYEFFK